MKLPVQRTRSALAASILAVVVSLTGACSHQIGDSCMSSVDCDPSGTRSCDLSQPGGYCTIMGCDETMCPSGATCIRTFPETLIAQNAGVAVSSVMCDPESSTGKQCDPGIMCATFGSCVKPCTPGGPASQCLVNQAGATVQLLCISLGYCAQCEPTPKNLQIDAGAPASPCQDAGTCTNSGCQVDEICTDSGLCAKQTLEQRQCAKSCSNGGDCRGGYECRKTGLLGSMVLATDPNAMTAFCAPDLPSTVTTP
jgi:hypothetical protein